MKLNLETITREDSGAVLARLQRALGTSAILEFARREVETGAMLDRTSGAYLFGPNPSVAPFAFHLVVFPSLSDAQVADYERSRRVQLPFPYKALLAQFNGLRAGRMSMYGLFDASFQANPRAEAAYVPFDVTQEHEDIRRKMRPYAHMFPIGGFHISASEVGKMVLAADGAVLLFNNAGQVLRSHSSVAAAVEAESARGLANAADLLPSVRASLK